MLHIDPRFLGVFLVLFIILGIFNIYQGARRVKILREHGYTAVWYKQVSYWTGIEYLLLGVVLLLNSAISIGLLPSSLAPVVIPTYIGVLVLAAIVLFVIFAQRMAARRAQAARNQMNQPATATMVRDTEKKTNRTHEQRMAQRERRKKAAAARRRQAGRA
jgi:protein-S-isoprenylcysteine O-methyltransferase Ste14